MPMATKRRPLAGWPARPPARRPLAGRPVMITGAASGIGRSLARRLSGLGWPVVVWVLDVRDAADQRRFAAEVLQWLPSLASRAPLAAVFNNAGVAVASS